MPAAILMKYVLLFQVLNFLKNLRENLRQNLLEIFHSVYVRDH